MRRLRSILLLAAALGLTLQAPAVAYGPASSDTKFDLPGLFESIVGQCPGLKGHKICGVGERLGTGLVCPPDPVSADAVDDTTPDCPFRARGKLAGDIKVYFEAEVELTIDIKVTGKKKKLKKAHVHSPKPTFPESARCDDKPTLEQSLVDVTTKVELKAGGGNAAVEAKAEIEAELKALQSDFCGKGEHGTPLDCRGEEIPREEQPREEQPREEQPREEQP